MKINWQSFFEYFIGVIFLPVSALLTSVLLTLFMSACSTSELSVSLAIIADATDDATLAIPILEQAGTVPVGIGNIILAYTEGVSTAAGESSAELLTADPVTIKSSKIIGYFKAVAVPVLGQIDPKAAWLVNTITSAVNLFLSHFSTLPASAVNNGIAARMKLPSSERHALSDLHARFVKTAEKARSLIQKLDRIS